MLRFIGFVLIVHLLALPGRPDAQTPDALWLAAATVEVVDQSQPEPTPLLPALASDTLPQAVAITAIKRAPLVHSQTITACDGPWSMRPPAHAPPVTLMPIIT